MLTAKTRHGFTLLELLTVMMIIAVLAALIIKGAGYAQNKAARSRATGEIAAISVALESYKADNGDYPSTAKTNGLDPSNTGKPNNNDYKPTSGCLALLLCGNRAGGTVKDLVNPAKDVPVKYTVYLDLPDSSLSATTDKIDVELTVGAPTKSRYIIDPFGNAYGYSTKGKFNPTYDLWSYAGDTVTTASPDRSIKWVTNW